MVSEKRFNEMDLEVFFRAHVQLDQCTMSSGISAQVLPAKLGFASANSLVGLKCAVQVPGLKPASASEQKEIYLLAKQDRKRPVSWATWATRRQWGPETTS